MRDVNGSLQKLAKRLVNFWIDDENAQVMEQWATPLELVRFELGLFLMEAVAPEESWVSLWAILGGHEPMDSPLTDQQKKQAARAKHYLLALRSFATVEHLADKYKRIPERLRMYEPVDAAATAFRRKAISVCPERQATYASLLDSPVPYHRRGAQWAQEGVYRFRHQGRYDSVKFHSFHLLPRPPQHPLLTQVNKPTRAPLAVPFAELAQTAQWMDEEENARNIASDERGHWERRFNRVTLDTWNESEGVYTPSKTLTLNGLFHLAGMVSSGKSTLMDILSVWAVRRGLRVVIIVGDVVGVLNRARVFARLGIDAAPILGGYNRAQHIARLHGAQQSSQPADDGPLSPTLHEGFRWISTGCPLDALRQEGKFPLNIGETPCKRLEPLHDRNEPDEEASAGQEKEQYTCPLYSGCPRHQAQRDLVNAPLWIGTPASFVYTRIDGAVGAERTHFAEMAYRRADLLLVDEADQVQVQLDNIFNPSQTLVDSNGDGWLNRLEQNVTMRLNRGGGRMRLTQEAVSAWTQTHRVAQSAVDRLYKEVQQNKNIQRWVNKENNYFTDWILLHQVVETLSGGSQEQHRQNIHPDTLAYDRLNTIIDDFIDDPLGEQNGETPLSRCAGALLQHRESGSVRNDLRDWIKENLSPIVKLSDDDLSLWGRRLEFGLLVAVLQSSVAYLAERWPDVESPLGLEESASGMFHRPPEAFFPLLPEPQMGQMLAFQYVPDKNEGKLRFFRCTAVGRWLLLRFPDLLGHDNLSGPHTLLLSGTSWAGQSPAYHVQSSVHGILKAPESEINAICTSQFRLQTFSDESGKPIAVSGKHGDERIRALHRIVSELTAVPDGASHTGAKSLLDRYLARIDQTDRRRALFLVGSYVEAKETYEHLVGTPGLLKPEDVCYLEADDGTFNAGYRGGALRRGVVHRFAQTGAKVLIAPLLAVERGHNILTEDGKYAALGAAFFLVRPHPPKDDLGFAIHSINRLGMARYGDAVFLTKCLQNAERRACAQNRPIRADLDTAAREFRDHAFREWRHLLYLPLIYSTLPDAERTAMTWSQLVTMWQVIGRLVRGGCAAHVYFCDAAFRLQTPSSSISEDEDMDSFSAQVPAPSLLREMKRVLREVLESEGHEAASMPWTPQERMLARTLYDPLFKALSEMGGL